HWLVNAKREFDLLMIANKQQSGSLTSWRRIRTPAERLFDLEVEPAHQRPPQRIFAGDLGRIVLRARGERDAGLPGDAGLELNGRDHGPQFPVEPLDDGPRNA